MSAVGSTRSVDLSFGRETEWRCDEEGSRLGSTCRRQSSVSISQTEVMGGNVRKAAVRVDGKNPTRDFPLSGGKEMVRGRVCGAKEGNML